jgi:cytochrome P450
VAAIDLAEIARQASAKADRLIEAAIANGGRLDVGHGYARLIAARTAAHLFGIHGPTEADLMRVCRALFRHAFLNNPPDPEIRERAGRAAVELREWILAEITRRRQYGIVINDVLGRLLVSRSVTGASLDDDGVRRNLAGMLLGAIDTTSTAVARIIAVLAARPEILTRVEADAHDAVLMRGWCYEALRMWPQLPLMYRRTIRDVSVRGRTIPRDRLVVAFAQAAMFDADIFGDPMRFDPGRPQAQYVNFGGGLHMCAGRTVNDAQLPELVRRIIARGIRHVGRPRYDGPFLDQLVVELRRPVS